MECMHELYIFSFNILILLDIVVWVCIQVRQHSNAWLTGYLSAAFFYCLSAITEKRRNNGGF